MAIFSAIAGLFSAVSGFIATLGPVGAFVLKAAVGIAVTLAAKALAGKPQDPTFSINGDLQGGGDLARSFIMGLYNTAGSLVWCNAWGKDGDTPNAWFTQVIALSDLPVKGLTEVWVDGVRVSYDPAGNNNTIYGYSIPQYENNGPNLYVKFYDGNQTAADPGAMSASSADRPYGADRIGYGVAYAVVHARATRNMFSGFPALRFTVDGMRLYDPSKDSTVGGTGTQRYGDRTTWGGDGDYLPAVQLYNLFRGLRYGTRWVYGLQTLTAPRLPSDTWIAAVLKCRATIPEAGGLQATYRSAGEITVDAPMTDATEAMLTACQGQVSETGGIYRLYVGEPGAPTIQFSDNDILSTEEQEFTPFMGLADTINGITATYPEPSDGWNVKTAPPLYRTDLEALDGGRRLLASVPFDFVPYSEQVQRLMKSALLSAQRFRRHTLVLPPAYWPYAVPGEVIAWSSARNGYVNKLMRIDGVSDRANLDVMLDITEVDPADYEWSSDTEFQPPVDGAVGPVIPQPQPIIDWFVEPYAITDNEENLRRPAIRITWDNSPDRLIGIIGVQWEVRDAETLEVFYRGRTDRPDVGSAIISANILPNTRYGVRGQLIPDPDRPMLWSDWLPVLTPNILLTADDIYAPGLIEGIEEFVSDATEFIRDGTRQSILEAQRIARLAADQEWGNFTARQSLRREVVLVKDSVTASYLEAITVALGPGSAFAQRIEELEVTIAGKASVEALDLLQVQVTEQGDALGEAITSLSAANVSGDTSTANFRMSVSAGPSGYASRIAAEARTGGAGGYRSAGWFLDVPATADDPTRFGVIADQFFVTDGTNGKNPLVFQSGALTLNVANIGTVNAGIITSPNGKMIININLGTIEIFS